MFVWLIAIFRKEYFIESGEHVWVAVGALATSIASLVALRVAGNETRCRKNERLSYQKTIFSLLDIEFIQLAHDAKILALQAKAALSTLDKVESSAITDKECEEIMLAKGETWKISAPLLMELGTEVRFIEESKLDKVLSIKKTLTTTLISLDNYKVAVNDRLILVRNAKDYLNYILEDSNKIESMIGCIVKGD